ncbi:glycoside hydrolase superfamily [Dioszegia hungarica]|uniref:Glycoside hydrolase superfamily n=1 Tax=Dioszegia hungarica TaxID=4972 RepID=A0AA38LRG6_9TREE|nr:glycoside hydrolase superfamily [Dioszegia hungarica]KAI9632985.1 glycoside hydrolase superfamily [Dioszegia hungarica]
MVKDAVEDVVSPALANALNLAAVGTTTVSDDKSVGTPSNGVFVVDPADIPSPDQRATSNSVSSATSQGDGSAAAPVVAATCNQGDWKCDGMTLKQCNWNNWLVVRQCTGDNIICSDQGSTVGCVWTWSVAQQATPSSSPSPASSNVQVAPVVQSPQSQAATTAQPTSVVQASPSPSPKASSAASPTVLQADSPASSASSAASASPRGSSSGSSSPTSTQLSSTTSTTSTTAKISASATPTTKGVVTATPSSIDRYSAPHYVIYSDYWLFSMPDVSTLKAFNRFVLAFWMSDQGPVDNAQMWVWMPQADRRRVLDAYHNAGIALMVSAFGSTDQPTTWGKDPLATAQQLAKFVVDYEFDGVDIDYEDMGAMNSDQAERWLIPFQKELRRLLPKPYLISHAPVAPWFTSSSAYRSGAYVAIHQSVGDGIDFYNMQFYNQGDGVYTDCNSLINSSGGYWPGTSVMEMNSYAKVPLNKIVIGKPLDAGKASNGYMSPQDLNVCVNQARGKGWNGGVMFWEWTTVSYSLRVKAPG